MATNETVKLLGMWASVPSKRVEWALKLKGVEYEYCEEDLANKSEELLRYNPVYKKVPVLVHNGKPLAESMVIVEYIDEVWKDRYPIMPKDPYERAQARFWNKFSDDKLFVNVIAVYTNPPGENLQKAVTEFQANLKILEEALKDKKFFGGESIGFVDIAVGWLATSLRMIEEIIDINVVNEGNFPLINAWIDRFLEVDIVKESLPPKDKIYAFNKARREQILSGQLIDRH